MKMKKICALFLAATMAAGMVSCTSAPSTLASSEAPVSQASPSPTGEPKPDAGAKVLKIGVLDRTADEEVHIQFGESIRNAGKEAGVEVLYSTPGEDLVKIRSSYDSYIAQGCNVIVDFLSSMEISQTLAEDCERDGVFHISIDADCTDISKNSYFYGLSNGDAGKALGEYLVNYVESEMGGKCDLLVLMDSPSHGEDVAKRTETPKAMLMEAYDSLNEDTVQYLSLTQYDLESVRQKATDFFTVHADAQNVIMISFASSFNDAIYSASKTSGFDDKLHLFSYDGLTETIKILKSGEKSVTKGEVSNGISRYGYDTVALAQKLVAGEAVESHSYANAQVMDAKNVNEIYPD